MKPLVFPATGLRLRTALSVLYSTLPPAEQAVRIANAEAASADGSLDLSHLLLAELNHEPAGALLLSIQETGIGSLWPPIVAPQHVIGRVHDVNPHPAVPSIVPSARTPSQQSSTVELFAPFTSWMPCDGKPVIDRPRMVDPLEPR